jgi:hypothetical protein
MIAIIAAITSQRGGRLGRNTCLGQHRGALFRWHKYRLGGMADCVCKGQRHIARAPIVGARQLHDPGSVRILAHQPSRCLTDVRCASLARTAAGMGRFVALPPPIDLGRFTISFVWHGRRKDEPRHVWLRRIIVAAARTPRAPRAAHRRRMWKLKQAFSDDDPIDREMVRSINEIGHLTGKQTIAEWAENAEIIEVLRGLGVDYAQGYGVSQPQKVQRAAIA